ncbi:TetR/AcrR family transcriptional regulator [Flindersiella endophytica]
MPVSFLLQVHVKSTVCAREAYRQATIDEIKNLARQQLAEQGPGGMSLRSIARQMRTSPSALYRYFASHDDLISTLCAEAFDSLADAVAAARDTRSADDHADRWWAICQAYRDWSLAHRADFALIFGTPVPGYQASGDVTTPAGGRLTTVALTTYHDAVRSGAADPGRTEIFGSLTHLIHDTDQLYRAHARAVMHTMGYQPALIQQLDSGAVGIRSGR